MDSHDPWPGRFAVVCVGLVAILGMWYVGDIGKLGREPTAAIAALLGAAVN
jgi:hypothetical protein